MIIDDHLSVLRDVAFAMVHLIATHLSLVNYYIVDIGRCKHHLLGAVLIMVSRTLAYIVKSAGRSPG